MSPSEAPESEEAELADGFLLVGHFQRFQRQRDLARGAIEGGDERIHPVADGEAFRRCSERSRDRSDLR